MDIKRAKQILSSSSQVEVHYHGVPVWIDSCDEASGMVNVHDMKSARKEIVQVNVSELEELG
ncbi:H-type small acid-soluble spore protein [Bacillus sp. 165]|uniref:H-type small acid-soluble spore protein n=1 Tax=Bacillus sp. 165 TaxID=1529117 RepID=UPI001AD9C202|nr:H-type small acid-soluble spore protein [Bacillus sp. 165]MBO9130863.1 H-type small acid-soluble spore protein [Bacillus sp. 165]